MLWHVYRASVTGWCCRNWWRRAVSFVGIGGGSILHVPSHDWDDINLTIAFFGSANHQPSVLFLLCSNVEPLKLNSKSQLLHIWLVELGRDVWNMLKPSVVFLSGFSWKLKNVMFFFWGERSRSWTWSRQRNFPVTWTVLAFFWLVVLVCFGHKCFSNVQRTYQKSLWKYVYWVNWVVNKTSS